MPVGIISPSLSQVCQLEDFLGDGVEDPLIDLTLVKPFGGLNDLMSFFIVLFPSLRIDILLEVCAYSSSYGCVPVPLHVKLKIGSTWGSLEPFQASE